MNAFVNNTFNKGIITVAYLFIFSALSTSLTMYFFQSRVISELLPAMFLALFLFQLFLQGKVRVLSYSHTVLLMGLACYMVFISMILNLDEPVRMLYLAKYFLLFIAFFLVFSVKDQNDFWIVDVLRFSVVLIALYSIFSILNVFFGLDHLTFSSQFGRGSGGQVGTISYAATLVMILPTVIFFRENKYIYFTILTLIILGIVSSGGRAAYIGLVLYLIVASSFIFPAIKKKISASLLIILVLLAGKNSDRIFSVFISESGGDVQRLDNYLSFFDLNRGWDIVFGFGIGRTSPGIKYISDYSFYGYESYILNILGELGIVVGAIFGILILLRIVNLAKKHRFYTSFFVPQLPIFFLQIAHENFTVLGTFCFLIILLTSLSKETLDNYVK